MLGRLEGIKMGDRLFPLVGLGVAKGHFLAK
jgi:hypothetical protein